MRHFKLLILVIVGLSLQVAPERTLAAAQPRVALVIGNSAYAEAPLANPANDARLMALTLRGLGFDVIESIDADRETMQLAAFELQDRLVAAGKDAIGLFYYAGHGVQVGGQNYLIPLNTEIKKEREVTIKAVSAGFILKQMEFAENRMNFVILDACRNNPLTRGFRSATRGLARMDAPRGSLVAYSTGPGEVAADGTGVNSPYTLALAQAMRTPGVPAEKMFKLVRNSVMAATKGEQTPWEESSLTGADFYFSVDVSVAPGEAMAAPPAPDAAPKEPAPALDPAEQAFWQAIADSHNPSDYRAYLQAYPDGVYAALAKSRTITVQSESGNQATRDASASELAFWEAIKDSDNAADYEAYLQQFPRGDFAALARVRLAAADEARRLEDERFEAERAVAEQKAAELVFWQSIEGSDNAADYQAYITTYPMGQFVELARVRMMTLAQAERQPAPPPTDVAALTPAEQSSAGEPLTASDREGTWDCLGQRVDNYDQHRRLVSEWENRETGCVATAQGRIATR